MSEYPHIQKTGRYLFFAVCAFGLSLVVYALVKTIGFADEVQLAASNISGLASFLALRDMDKAARSSVR